MNNPAHPTSTTPPPPAAARLVEIMENLPAATIALVGDLMLDRYVYGNAERLSPEAPVPVLHFQRQEHRAGGAGSVAANLAALGAAVRMVSAVGEDDNGKLLRQHLAQAGVDDSAILRINGRPTVCKLRLVGLAQHRHPQQMLRLDDEDCRPLPGEVVQQLRQNLVDSLDGASALCIEDYNKGLLSDDFCKQIIAEARSRKIPVLVDPAAITDYSKYAHATAIKLNRTETQQVTGIDMNEPAHFEPAARRLIDMLDLEAAIITLDKSGAYLATRDGPSHWLKTRPRQVYDVTGAGDMVLAMLAMARSAGATWAEAVALSNIAGGLEVERFGAVPIRPGEIIEELMSDLRLHLGKQRTLPNLLVELGRHRDAGRKIVFTNGCFDLLHLGHIKYFQFAKAQGDLLVVGVNTDDSIRRLKGNSRPIIPQADRLAVLEELESIDYLVPFDDDTPLNLIHQVRPDVLVKGADYQKEQVVGWDFVESRGGRVALAPLIDGRSTSAVIRRILEMHGER
jgi:D-beta-D-heptose 7-phosphate kinase/D-beta-D-heptose 1-phosphate adenosyltransferase